jgi:hypothetical protein
MESKSYEDFLSLMKLMKNKGVGSLLTQNQELNSKIEKIENKKHTNRIITYLKCKKQFSHEFKLDRTIINNIINKISNSNFDAIPHDPFAFNNIIMGIIKQVEAKEGLKTKAAGFLSTPKNLSSQGCGANCDGFKSCKSGCPTCASSTLFGEMTCR